MLHEERKSQIFPTLTPRQLEFALRFTSGPARRFAAGESVFDVGDIGAGVAANNLALGCDCLGVIKVQASIFEERVGVI